MKRLLLLLTGVVCTGFLWSQSAEIKGTVYAPAVEEGKFEGASFAFIQLYLGNTAVYKTTADVDGKYWIQGIAPGTYKMAIKLLGYLPDSLTGLSLSSGEIRMRNVKLVPESYSIGDGAMVSADSATAFKIGDPVGLNTFNLALVKDLPVLDVIDVFEFAPGQTVKEREGISSFGKRGGNTLYFNGVKMNSDYVKVPLQAIEEAQLFTLGQPVYYGDNNGAVGALNMRTIMPAFFGGVEGRTSQFLDKYGFNNVTLYAGGPLAWRKDSTGTKLDPVASFFVSLDGSHVKDGAPLAGGEWKLKDDYRNALLTSPLLLSDDKTVARLSSEFLRKDAFERVAARQNAATYNFNLNAKLDFQLARYTTFSAGTYISIDGGRNSVYSNALLNPQNNPMFEGRIYSVFGKFTQRFFSKSDTSDTRKGTRISQAQISLQVDYLRQEGKTFDENHGNRFFDYGYIGKFDLFQTPAFVYGYDPKTGTSGWLYQGNRDTLITFSPGSLNPDVAAYTSQYYTFFNQAAGHYDQYTSIRNGGAFVNGDLPRSPYSIWNNAGATYNGFSQSENNQFRVTGQGKATWGDHNFLMGFEFETRSDRAYSINPVGLWTNAYLRTNSHLGTLDTSAPQLLYNATTGQYADTILYPALFRLDENKLAETGYTFGVGQSFFDWNLRRKLGLATNSLDFINVHGLDPSLLSVNMFSADELFNQGNSLVNYFGYDAYGNRSADNSSFSDFFTARDKYGNYTRPVGAFQPVYMAGYIADQFSFKDIMFNIGVRVDRFDANQKVLKDRYSLYETFRAGEISELGTISVQHPGNIGNEYVVYVNDGLNPTEVVGYRNGDTWYNASGEQINDPSVLRTSSGRVQPLLVNPSASIQTPGFDPSAAFTDYKPQVNVMPRISVSFPVSQRVQFLAHYDVLTQRPSNVRMNMLDILYWDNPSYNSGGTIFNNPSLRPDRTTDFSLGLRTFLNEEGSIGLKISAFYREIRDMLAIVKVSEAYPRSYMTFDNIDFATVKGLFAEFQIRKGGLNLNASYTLQFADGTGSSAFSQLNLVNGGQPNLRSTIPLSFDRRHLISFFASYSIGEKQFTSPVANTIFKNMTFSLTLQGGSGFPYSKQSNVTGAGFLSGGGQGSLLGSIHGARFPWQFTSDLLVAKDFTLKFYDKDKLNFKAANLQIYMAINNLFGNINQLQAYQATGSATDDGYLTSAQFQSFINSQLDSQSFRDLYEAKVNNPYNRGIPRTIRLGFRLGF